MSYLFLCYNLIRSAKLSCTSIINRVHISLLNLQALPTHFNRVNVLGNNSFEFQMPEMSSGITSDISILANNYNQSSLNNIPDTFRSELASTGGFTARSIAGLILGSLQLRTQLILPSLGWCHKSGESLNSREQRSPCFCIRSGGGFNSSSLSHVTGLGGP